MKTTKTVNRRKLYAAHFLAVIVLTLSCLKEGRDTLVLPTAPSDFLDRPNDHQGTFRMPEKHIEISLWDHASIDGDIVSLFINGALLVQQLTLDGPENKYVIQTTLNDGANALVLFAHNEGSSPPNTATVSVKSGAQQKEMILNADLKTNALVELVVD